MSTSTSDSIVPDEIIEVIKEAVKNKNSIPEDKRTLVVDLIESVARKNTELTRLAAQMLNQKKSHDSHLHSFNNQKAHLETLYLKQEKGEDMRSLNSQTWEQQVQFLTQKSISYLQQYNQLASMSLHRREAFQGPVKKFMSIENGKKEINCFGVSTLKKREEETRVRKELFCSFIREAMGIPEVALKVEAEKDEKVVNGLKRFRSAEKPGKHSKKPKCRKEKPLTREEITRIVQTQDSGNCFREECLTFVEFELEKLFTFIPRLIEDTLQKQDTLKSVIMGQTLMEEMKSAFKNNVSDTETRFKFLTAKHLEFLAQEVVLISYRSQLNTLINYKTSYDTLRILQVEVLENEVAAIIELKKNKQITTKPRPYSRLPDFEVFKPDETDLRTAASELVDLFAERLRPLFSKTTGK